jgi:hypothetical protein
VQHPAREERPGGLRAEHRRAILAGDFVLGCALDENGPAAATADEVQSVLEPDSLRRLLASSGSSTSKQERGTSLKSQFLRRVPDGLLSASSSFAGGVPLPV